MTWAYSTESQPPPLRDRFGRQITYLRLSVTDRCDFRCIYCMDEDMTFLPRREVLSLEELLRVGRAFVELGISKIRITGGEPLIRRNVLSLFEQLGQLEGLEELCLTTNGARLTEFARPLAAAGVNRINISLDSLRAERFKTMTRYGELHRVLAGIDAAQEAGFERIKINTVMMQHYNADELFDLVDFALQRGLDISFIEEMPLGHVRTHNRAAEFISSQHLRQRLQKRYELMPDSGHITGGPARYWIAKGHSSRIGFISPHSENFCASCNRVRVSAAGRLLLCLGNEHSVDLRELMRHNDEDRALRQAIIRAIDIKPEKHHFALDDQPQIVRFMNMTGG